MRILEGKTEKQRLGKEGIGINKRWGNIIWKQKKRKKNEEKKKKK